MAKSMTGYGKCESVTEEKQIVVEIRSVNNRYLDVNVKCPRFMMFAEEKIKALVGKYTMNDVYLEKVPIQCSAAEKALARNPILVPRVGGCA